MNHINYSSIRDNIVRVLDSYVPSENYTSPRLSNIEQEKLINTLLKKSINIDIRNSVITEEKDASE